MKRLERMVYGGLVLVLLAVLVELAGCAPTGEGVSTPTPTPGPVEPYTPAPPEATAQTEVKTGSRTLRTAQGELACDVTVRCNTPESDYPMDYTFLVEVRTADGGEVLQTLEHREDIQHPPEMGEGLYTRDLNGDGSDDVLIKMGIRGKMEWWLCYVYDGESGQYTAVPGFDELWSPTPYLDVTRRVVFVTEENPGHQDRPDGHHDKHSKFVLDGDRLVLTANLYYDWKGEGAGGYYTEERYGEDGVVSLRREEMSERWFNFGDWCGKPLRQERIPDQEPPLDEYDLSGPVPEFLTEEQQLLYRRAGNVYLHLFGGDTDAVVDWPLANGSRLKGSVSDGSFDVGDTTYNLALGRYQSWADFDALVHSVFTDRYFRERNEVLTTEEGETLPIFREYNGRLAYVSLGRGTGYTRNGYFPDTFELIEQTEDRVSFYLVGYYSYCYPIREEYLDMETYDFDQNAREKRLMSGYEYSEKWRIDLVLTEDGWRFDSFADTSADEPEYRGIYE